MRQKLQKHKNEHRALKCEHTEEEIYYLQSDGLADWPGAGIVLNAVHNCHDNFS